jgi:hypothetical protein
LLDVLLTARVSFQSPRSEHAWAYIPPIEGGASNGQSQWLQRHFSAPLVPVVAGELTQLTEDNLEEVEPNEYYTNAGHDGRPLRVPSDLDESICRYRDLSNVSRDKFDRAVFWMDMASRQWAVSLSSSLASLVSAAESLTERGTRHWAYCVDCNKDRSHEEPGATERFRAFLETYAPGSAQRERRTQMYALRSGILHGSVLMQIDEGLAFGWDPPGRNEIELHTELWGVTRLALRNWLKNPPVG